MKKYLPLLFLIFFLSCSESSVPVGVISIDKMSELLKEIHYAEASIPTGISADSTKKVIVANYNFIFKRFKVDKKEFQKSMNYYIKHPDKLDKVYQNIIDLVNQDDLIN